MKLNAAGKMLANVSVTKLVALFPDMTVGEFIAKVTVPSETYAIYMDTAYASGQPMTIVMIRVMRFITKGSLADCKNQVESIIESGSPQPILTGLTFDEASDIIKSSYDADRNGYPHSIPLTIKNDP